MNEGNAAENLENTEYESNQIAEQQQPTPQPAQQQWWSSLSEEMQGEASRYKSIQEMVKSNIFLKSLLSKKVSDFSGEDNAS